MILGTGVDIVNIKRIEKIIDKWGTKFLQKIYTEKEIIYCYKKKNFSPHFAARFAAKEATAKMFGSGIGKISWSEIEVINNKEGKPLIRLKGKAKKLYKEIGIENIHLSLSHEKEYAVAQVIAEGGKNDCINPR